MQDKLVAHNVYFELKDNSKEAVEKLIADCHRYMKQVEGIIFFSAGVIHEEHRRDVNVRDFHAATFILFRDQESHDNYQSCDLHRQFIERNRDNWKSIRVFDWLPDYSG